MRALAFLFLVAISTAIGATNPPKPDEVEIRIFLVAYARTDLTKAENRLIILGHQAHRTVRELITTIRERSLNAPLPIRIAYQVPDVVPRPRLTSAERDEIKAACDALGIKFIVYPGG